LRLTALFPTLPSESWKYDLYEKDLMRFFVITKDVMSWEKSTSDSVSVTANVSGEGASVLMEGAASFMDSGPSVPDAQERPADGPLKQPKKKAKKPDVDKDAVKEAPAGQTSLA